MNRIWKVTLGLLIMANVGTASVFVRSASADTTVERWCGSGTIPCACIEGVEICSAIPPLSDIPCEVQWECWNYPS